MWENRPIPDFVIDDFWDAWNWLHAHREVGMSAFSLQAKEIQAWMEINGIEDQKEMYHYIMVIDDHWLAWMRKDGNSKTGN
jgi:hypothetical protein